MSRLSRRQRDRQNALDAATHAYAIARAQSLTRDETEKAALVRWGPVPATCQQCNAAPPRVIQVVGSGRWLCRSCAGLDDTQEGL